jgi:hypothetical protein
MHSEGPSERPVTFELPVRRFLRLLRPERTSLSTGGHLHREARVHGVKIDPTLLTLAPLEP